MGSMFSEENSERVSVVIELVLLNITATLTDEFYFVLFFSNSSASAASTRCAVDVLYYSVDVRLTQLQDIGEF